MGSYTDLSVGGYPILETKSAVVPEAMTIFRETDKRVFTRKISQRNELIWGQPDAATDDVSETAIQYACETGKIIDRLSVMGFTQRRVREDFESLRRAELDESAAWADEREPDWFRKKREFFQLLTFDDYATALGEVIEKRLRPTPFDDRKREGLDPTVKYVLTHNEDHLLGFLGSDIRSLLRLTCELVDVRSEVVQDITELVAAGYYEEKESVCDNAIRDLTTGHPENSPRIILTEGSTDIAVLRSALELLYPHLTEYYTFFDFGSSRSRGGAGHLVAIVKAFAAAGITNRVVALFDNDTVARDARRTLSAISLPPNIVVLHYPHLARFRHYPTLGPSGLSRMDINGLAASIELYLGEDILSAGGTPTPVQWKGYNETLGEYQGEVIHKTELLLAFERKVERCRSDESVMNEADWVGLRAILQAVFRAFE